MLSRPLCSAPELPVLWGLGAPRAAPGLGAVERIRAFYWLANEGSPKVPTHPVLRGVLELRSGPEKHSDVPMAAPQSELASRRGTVALARSGLSSGEEAGKNGGGGGRYGGEGERESHPDSQVRGVRMSGSFEELALHLAG